MIIELFSEGVIMNTSYISIIEVYMPKAVFLGPNFHYLAFSMMIKQLRHISIKAKYKGVNARFLDVIGKYTVCQLPLLDIMVILTPLLDILTPLFRISSVQLMT